MATISPITNYPYSIYDVGLLTGSVPSQRFTPLPSPVVSPLDTIEDSVSLSLAAASYLESLGDSEASSSTDSNISQQAIDAYRAAADNLRTIAYLDIAEAAFRREQALFAYDEETRNPFYNPTIDEITIAAGAASSAATWQAALDRAEAFDNPTFRPTPEPEPYVPIVPYADTESQDNLNTQDNLNS